MKSDPLEQICKHPKLCNGGNIVVGISGIDGSGKSTYAKDLLRQLDDLGTYARLVALDDFLHPKPIRHANPDQVAGYFDENFDFATLLNKIISPVSRMIRCEAVVPVLDLDTDTSLEQRFEFDGPGILVVEGVFLFRQELQDEFDVKIWMNTSFDEALDRVLGRLRDQRYGDANAIAARYQERFFPAQKYHLERDDPAAQADIVVMSNGLDRISKS